MTPDEGTKQPEPEFDPATWTPDKPWPKGYYKPMLGIDARMERINRITGRSSEDAWREIISNTLVFASQVAGVFAAANPWPSRGFGPMFTAINRTVTVWPTLIFFVLVLPVLLCVAIVPKPGTPLRRSLAYGLVRTLVSLAFLLFMAVARPLVNWLFAVVLSAMTS